MYLALFVRFDAVADNVNNAKVARRERNSLSALSNETSLLGDLLDVKCVITRTTFWLTIIVSRKVWKISSKLKTPLCRPARKSSSSTPTHNCQHTIFYPFQCYCFYNCKNCMIAFWRHKSDERRSPISQRSPTLKRSKQTISKHPIRRRKPRFRKVFR